MRRAAFAFVMAASIACAQSSQNSQNEDWRSALLDLPEHPTANLQDLQRFERHLTMAMPYFGTLTPGDYEANRELVRRIVMYQAGLDMLYRNPQVTRDPLMRSAVGRVRNVIGQMRSYAIFSMAYGGAAGASSEPRRAEQPAPAVMTKGEPPFSMNAPRLEKISAADAKIAHEICSLYETDAARSAAAWQSAETLRVSLEKQGMSLNVQTAASVGRLQLYFESAAASIRERDWEEARLNLQRAEGETEKIFRTVGR